MKNSKKRSSFIPCMALIVAMTFFANGCGGSTDSSTASGAAQAATIESEGGVLGEGDTQFAFIVVDKNGNETSFEIHTDQETVGEALLDLSLIAGTEGGYGLYVETVNGITVDYDTDGAYWAFYINDDYAQTGVDSTPITEGDVYSFRVE